VNILCLQLDTKWEDPGANREKIGRMVSAAPRAPGDLVVLPELCLTGFTMNSGFAESAGGESERFFSDIAAGSKVFILAGLAVKTEHGIANQAVIFDPDGIVQSRYDKIHQFTPSGEHEHYCRGEQVVVAGIGGMQAAPMICYDLRFPETFRQAVSKGAGLFVVIANWPAARSGHWRALLAARAIENQAFVAGVNRVGSDPENEYAGDSVVFDPKGELVESAGNSECVMGIAIDPALTEQWRSEFPAVKDR